MNDYIAIRVCAISNLETLNKGENDESRKSIYKNADKIYKLFKNNKI
jgi:hypothetical protein